MLDTARIFAFALDGGVILAEFFFFFCASCMRFGFEYYKGLRKFCFLVVALFCGVHFCACWSLSSFLFGDKTELFFYFPFFSFFCTYCSFHLHLSLFSLSSLFYAKLGPRVFSWFDSGFEFWVASRISCMRGMAWLMSQVYVIW